MADDWERYYDALYEEADTADEPSVTGAANQQSSNPLYDTLRKISHRYENETIVGEGGWKVIYRVHDVCANRDVALARPRPGSSGESYDAFLREAHITAKLEHANIIKLFDMGVEENGTPFFTMEFKRGKSLLERLREARDNKAIFPLEERLQVFLAICDAMCYAHSRRVLHLDLKPENIQVGAFGEVQVCDWGLGEIVIERNDEILSADTLLDPDLYGNNGDLRQVKGTPGFMAPEQKKPGEPRTYKTDVFALGKTLAVLVVGAKPIPALAAIIAKATAEKPADRYDSVKELQDDVHRFITLHPTSVEPGGFGREAYLFMRRNQRSCIIATLGLVSTMILSSYFLAELEVYRHDQAAAEAQAQRALSDLKVTELKKQLAEAQAVIANNKANTAVDMAQAMLEGRHRDAYNESLLLMNVMGADPFNGERTLDETIEYLNDALKKGTLSEAQVRQQLGYAHFVAQRFKEAEEYYTGLAADPDLQELLPSLQKKLSHNINLSERDFSALIIKLAKKGENSRLALIEKMMVYDSVFLRKKDKWFDRMKIAVTTLRAFNPEWFSQSPNIEDKATWNENAQHLELKGEGLATLANTRDPNRAHLTSLLQTVPLKSLTLRNTEVKDLSHIASLSLWQLELINTTPTSFEPLRQMKSLRILKVDRPELLEQARVELQKDVMVELIK